MPRKTHRKIRELKSSYSVIVDGKTEVWYFQLMKTHEKLPRINIEPELPKKKKLSELFGLAKKNARDYDRVFLLSDLYAIIHDAQIDELRKYFDETKKNEKITILFNNPCLEFWFLLHFKKTAKYFSRCSEVISELKNPKRLENYSKTEKYFKQKYSDIYVKLKPFQSTACANANKLGEFSFQNVQSAKAEIVKIIDFFLSESHSNSSK